MPRRIVAHAWFNGRGPVPPRPAVLDMVAQLQGAMDALGLAPLTERPVLKCEVWRCPAAIYGKDNPGANLAKITVECMPGERLRSLITWFEWQHPHWHWSTDDIPTIGLIAALIVAPDAQAVPT